MNIVHPTQIRPNDALQVVCGRPHCPVKGRLTTSGTKYRAGQLK